MAKLSDSEILDQLTALVKQEQRLTVAVLAHLAEVERRELHLIKGCSSLFAYCVNRLGFSEDVAYKRVGAARYGRRFPLALDLLAQGALHLSGLMLVGPHLTDVNHREWLTAVVGKSKREIELLVATRCPKPDVPSSVRKLPRTRAGARAPSNDDAAATGSQHAEAPPMQQEVVPQTQHENASNMQPAEACPGGRAHAAELIRPDRADASQGRANREVERAAQPALTGDTDASLTNAAQTAIAGEPQPSRSCARAADRPLVQPLSGSTFRVVFTAGEALKHKLDRARELCSHSVAPADLPALLERALDLLIEREEKRRYALRSPKDCKPKGTSDTRSACTPLPRSHQDPDPVEPIEPETRPPEPTAPAETTTRTLDPVEHAEPDMRALHPVASVDAETEPPSCSRKQGPGLFEPLSSKEFSRHVPAAVRRAVWERDGGQCTFVDDEGNRCTERRFLEIDHIVAHARGGPTAIGNCQLTCRAHNQHRAKLTFGSDFMDRARSRPRTR